MNAPTSDPTRQSLLIERIRAYLSDRKPVREVKMFGGLSFMVNEKMVASVFKNGDLLLRVDPVTGETLCTRAHIQQAEMGKGRSMGPGWVSASAEAVTTDEQLHELLEETLEFNRYATSQKP